MIKPHLILLMILLLASVTSLAKGTDDNCL